MAVFVSSSAAVMLARHADRREKPPLQFFAFLFVSEAREEESMTEGRAHAKLKTQNYPLRAARFALTRLQIVLYRVV